MMAGFFKRCFPHLLPSNIYFNLVPDDKIEQITDVAVKTGSLNKVGSGAVFKHQRMDAHVSAAFPTEISSETNNSNSITNTANLEAI